MRCPLVGPFNYFHLLGVLPIDKIKELDCLGTLLLLFLLPFGSLIGPHRLVLGRGKSTVDVMVSSDLSSLADGSLGTRSPVGEIQSEDLSIREQGEVRQRALY
jgi:hypothetical protein